MSRSDIFVLHEKSKLRFSKWGAKLMKESIFSGRLMLNKEKKYLEKLRNTVIKVWIEPIALKIE